jgi:hypothetical protein
MHRYAPERPAGAGAAVQDRTEIDAPLSIPSFSYATISFSMNRRAIFAPVLAAGLLAAFVPDARAQVARAPWFGTWQLIPPESTSRFDSPPYKKVTSRIEPWEDGLKVTYDMVRTRGGIAHMEWTGRFDGKDYPVQGVDYVLTNAYRLINERSYEIVIKRDGQVAATAIAVVSADGATLTVTTAEKDQDGKGVTTAAVYRKQ